MKDGYVFIKTHKVGGTSVTQMLSRTLEEANNVTQCDYPNRSSANPLLGCRSCLDEPSRGRVAAAFRAPHLLAAQSAVQKVCPFWVPGRRLHTMIMLREPVDRLYARYYYQLSDGWCRRKAATLGMQGCASDHYGFVDWALAPSPDLVEQGLFRPESHALHAETVHALGGSLGVAGALRVLKRIEVVGVTSRFNETLAVLSFMWGLPMRSLNANLEHLNKHTKPRDSLNSSFILNMLALSHGLRAEHILYDYASERLTLTSTRALRNS